MAGDPKPAIARWRNKMLKFNHEVGEEATNHHGSTDEFRMLLELSAESVLANLARRRRYFGILSALDLTEKQSSTILDIWTSMLERRLGTESFRVIVGKEEKRDRIKRFHVFIGGITSQKAFQRIWIERWIDLGGSGASLFPFEPCLVRAYAEALSQQISFDCTVKQTATRQHP
jgi:hypothetical protein